jgi:hypothetical protein
MTTPILFQGEMMHCLLCDKEEPSYPHLESQWRAITIPDAGAFYACPDHFPPDTGSTKEFAAAYTFFILEIFKHIAGGKEEP